MIETLDLRPSLGRHARPFVGEIDAQPCFGDRPFPDHGGSGNAKDLGGFVDCQPAEVTQFDNPFLLRIEGGKPFE